MSFDIFSKNFKPYIAYTKGFYAYDQEKRKKVFIKSHYTYHDKYSVRPINFKDKKDREIFYKLKKENRILYNK